MFHSILVLVALKLPYFTCLAKTELLELPSVFASAGT